MNKELNIKKINITDKQYPKQLGVLKDAPKVLYYRGNLNALNYKYAVAIVGTRRCSQYGIETTCQITKELARTGITIVSGLARGIDTLAHKTALEYGAPTIDILGSGIDDT